MPLRSVKMKRFIFGFQRRVWWPKWTPLSSSWRIVTTAMGRAPLARVAAGGHAHAHRLSRGGRVTVAPDAPDAPDPCGTGRRAPPAAAGGAGACEVDPRA